MYKAEEIVEGTELIVTRPLECRSTPWLEFGDTVYKIPIGVKLTAMETPRNYEGCGRCIAFKVDGDDQIFYEFWRTFKSKVDTAGRVS